MKKYFVGIVTAIVVILAASLIFSMAYIVNEDTYGIVRQFGKVVEIRDEAGLYFKIPFVEDVSYLPKNKRLYDVTPSDVLTSDKKALVVDSFVIWRIEDPLDFVQSIGTIEEMERRLDAATFSVVKNTMGTMEQSDIIQASTDAAASRNEVNRQITENVHAQISEEYGVQVLAVEIKKLDLPEDNEAAVYKRMISDREQIAAAYIAEGELEASKIRNETDKSAAIIISVAESEAEKIRGEGEAEYMRIMAEAYSSADQREFYEFIRSLEMVQNSFAGENLKKKTLILPADSVIAQMFIGD